jgi:quinol-cytochrome oxidoreductase complex cytochrome b subunit
VKDIFGLCLFTIFFCFFVFLLPNYLGHSDNYIEANALVTPHHIVPEWYFLPYYAILRSIPSKLGGFLCMIASILIFLTLPYLNMSELRSSEFRPIYRKAF